MTEIIRGGDPMEFARSHPTFFFNTGVANELDHTARLVMGAQALGAKHVEAISLHSWSIVAAELDWFATAAVTVFENEVFTTLRACIELGQNSIRPEGVVGAFAQSIVVRSPQGIRTIKGQVEATDPILSFLAEHSNWPRAIAFRGIEQS